MTTIVVVRKGSDAVIAADTLTTFGSTRLSAHDDSAPDKIVRIGPSYFGIAGSAAHQLVFENLMEKNPQLTFGTRAEIFESFRRLHPLLKEEAFLNPKDEEDDPYESSQITTLIANAHGLFGVYSLREVFEFEHFWAIGSGRDFALGAMQVLYPKLKSAGAIAQAALGAAAHFDNATALPMTLYSVELLPER